MRGPGPASIATLLFASCASFRRITLGMSYRFLYRQSLVDRMP